MRPYLRRGEHLNFKTTTTKKHLRIEGTHLNIIKAIQDKTTDNAALNGGGKLKAFPLKEKEGMNISTLIQ